MAVEITLELRKQCCDLPAEALAVSCCTHHAHPVAVQKLAGASELQTLALRNNGMIRTYAASPELRASHPPAASAVSDIAVAWVPENLGVRRRNRSIMP